MSSVFKNIFLVIEMYDKYCMVHAWVISHKQVAKKEKKKFFYDKKNKTPDVLLNFVYEYTKKYTQHYLAVILNSSHQKTLLEDSASKKFLQTLKESNVSIPVHPKWRIYAPIRDVEKIQKELQPLDVDFVVSPMAILHHLCTQSNKDDNHVYILALSYVVSIAIFRDSVAVASVTLSLLTDEANSKENFDFTHPDDVMEDEFELDSDIQKSDLDLEDESFELESEDNIKIKEEVSDDLSDGVTSELVKNIQYVIEQFYSSPYYNDDNDLIGSIVIFNQDILTTQLRAQLRDEMMLEIFHKEVNVVQAVTTIMTEDFL